MIVVLIHHTNTPTFRHLLKGWGRELRPQMKMICYCDLISKKSLPRATYLFADIELLSPLDLKRACEVAKQLIEAGMPILNDPHWALKRYDLLKVLYEEGLNKFRAYRVDEIGPDGEIPRMPVFVRRADDHRGSISEVLSTSAELESCLQGIKKEGGDLNELIVTEYCDVADSNGIFAKYSTYFIGKEFIPRSVVFNTDWVTKTPSVVNEETVDKEADYVYTTPHLHEEMLRRIYSLAHIDYGRIDYGVKDGRIQTWEINTNPYIHPTPSNIPKRFQLQRERTQKLCDAFKDLDKSSPLGPKIRLRLTADKRAELKVKLMDRYYWPSLRWRYSVRFARQYFRRWRGNAKK